MRFLVTGTAGFIGFHVAKRLVEDGHTVTGVDGFTTYYDIRLKESRQALLDNQPGFHGHRSMLEDRAALARAFADSDAETVIHLAAQAGVRYSLENPRAYVDSNLVGTFNLMELIRERPVRHFLMASTSSVYGANAEIPFREVDRTDHALTIYAATKKATEVMAHSYSHLWNIPTTAFRFFTVYGPWGRPDMAPSRFLTGILRGTPIDIYNHGDMARDFTFIDDLVEAIVRLIPRIPSKPGAAAADPSDSLSPTAPFRVVNIGAGQPVNLLTFIEVLEAAAGARAIRHMKPMQTGDVPRTFASVDLLRQLTGYRASTSIEVGIPAFVDWYRAYYHV